MSERQQKYVISQAQEIAAQRDKELERQELRILHYQIERAIGKANQIIHDAVSDAPVQAFLVTRLGAHWQDAHVVEYVLNGISIWTASVVIKWRGKPTVLSEVVFQVEDSYKFMEKKGKESA